MGKVEKIIVLSVLFLVTLILVISLNTTETGQGSATDPRIARIDPIQDDRDLDLGEAPLDPRDELVVIEDDPLPAQPAPVFEQDPRMPEKEASRDEAYSLLEGGDARTADPTPARPAEREMQAGADLQDEPVAAAETEEPARSGGLLSSTVRRTPRPEERIPAGSVLITMQGLEDSFTQDLKIYRLAPGDTLTGVAERFYGNRRKANLLRSANEGLGRLIAGEKIFVPVFETARGEEAPVNAGTVAVHLVEEGESLWSIAESHYGSGARWRSVFEANRDVLADEHSLKVGMRLRIP